MIKNNIEVDVKIKCMLKCPSSVVMKTLLVITVLETITIRQITAS